MTDPHAENRTSIRPRPPFAIEDAAAFLAAIVASSNDAILSKSLEGIITSWNAATAELFGYSAEEMIGRSIRVLIPDDRQAEEDHILEQIANGERIENYETVRLRKNGTPIEVSVTISPIRDARGEIVGASKIIRDITQRRENERRIETLMSEVNHRAKNLLGLVQAIANQTRAQDIGDFRERFSARLQALAANQDLLVSRSWQSVSLSDLVDAELSPFPPALHGRIAIDGEPIDLSPSTSQVLSMALHELATNSIKYGALSNDVGQVSISWNVSGERFSMTWNESGGPEVVQTGHAGFGTRVLRDLVEARLDGRVCLEFSPAGVVWRFEGPVASMVAEA